MSGPVFAVLGGPTVWYVHQMHGGGSLDVASGPWFDRALADADQLRLSAPHPAEGVVFTAAFQEPDDDRSTVQIAVCVSLASAQQALDAHLKDRRGVAQVSPWQSASMACWQRQVLWDDGDTLQSTWQTIQRVHVRKEDK